MFFVLLLFSILMARLPHSADIPLAIIHIRVGTRSVRFRTLPTCPNSGISLSREIPLGQERWMSTFGIRLVPPQVLAADDARFTPRRVRNIITKSGLDVDVETVQAYCHWFVGSDYDWKSDWNGRGYSGPTKAVWSGIPIRPMRWNTGQLASFLAGTVSPDGKPYSLHTKCKQGSVEEAPFYWTRFLAIDLDLDPGDVQGLHRRYEGCRRLFGTPLVIQSPRRGLHLYWPLKQPVSVLGVVARGNRSLPVLFRTMLAGAGLPPASRRVELRPTDTQTLRLPYPHGGEQLDPESLSPLPFPDRPARLRGLVDTMAQLAGAAPLDVFALAARQVAFDHSSVASIAVKPITKVVSDDGPDLQRLLLEGLYPGVTRNQAALLLTRHWMRNEGRTIEETVAALLHWTATKTNGLSKEAPDLSQPAGLRRLEQEYVRMCRGVERFMVSHGRRVGSMGSQERFLTATETEQIFAATAEYADPCERYRQEVFLFCLLGFAKRHMKETLSRAPDDTVRRIRAELSARMMQRWPGCAGASYRKCLTEADRQGFCRALGSYWVTRPRRPGKARSYAIRIDASTVHPIHINPGALLEAVERLTRAGHGRIHAQQVEHAFRAQDEFAKSLAARYGPAKARRMRELVEAYRCSLGEMGCPRVAA